MANKVYTATELREAANVVDDVSVNDYGEYFYEKDDKFNQDIVRDMLRQAADAMEREERREKRYHYEVWYTAKDGGARRSTGRAMSLEAAKRILSMYREFKDAHIVRREVGEWKVVTE